MKKVLKFQASWCGPCKALSETIKNVKDLDAQFTEIDIDENMDKAIEFNIRTVPTLVLVSEDESELKRIVGALTQQQLREFING